MHGILEIDGNDDVYIKVPNLDDEKVEMKVKISGANEREIRNRAVDFLRSITLTVDSPNKERYRDILQKQIDTLIDDLLNNLSGYNYYSNSLMTFEITDKTDYDLIFGG